MDKLLHNPLDAWKEGAQKWGENIMQSVIESVFANQDKGLTQLQELQKWNVVKLIQKIITTRFFVRETPFVPLRESPLLNRADLLLQPGLKSITCKKRYAVGHLCIRIDCAESLLLQSWKHIDAKTAKKIIWKAVIRAGSHVIESDKVLLTDPLLNMESDSTNSILTALKWPPKDLNLGAVYDLHTDVVVELHRKLVRDPVQPGRFDPASSGDDYAMSDLSALFGQKRANPPEPFGDSREVLYEKPQLSASEQEESDTVLPSIGINFSDPTTLPPTMTEDEGSVRDPNNMSIAKLPVNCWQLYGMVIIPLTSLIHTAEIERKSSQTRAHSTRIHENRNEKQIELDGWFHLYPPNQRTRELKFLRPCSGYPGIGMTNPRISLGMVKINLKFFTNRTNSKFWLSPLISNLNRPKQIWRLASKLDLQVFENVGLRTHQAAFTLPRWTQVFTQPCRIFETLKSQNKSKRWSEIGYLTAFWLILIHTTVLAPLPIIPIEIEGLAPGVYYPLDRYYLPCSKSGIKGKPTPLPNDFFPSAMGIKSARMKDISKWMELNPLHLGTARAPHLDVPIKQALLKKSISWIEPDCDDSSEVPLNHCIPSMHFPVTSHTASSIGSVFGRLDISITDPASFVPVHPIFSDDVSELNLYDLKHFGIAVLEAVQFFLSFAATTAEKLKCAYNWSDPSLSRVAWILTCMLSLEAAVVTWILSKLPPTVLRTIFFLIPLATVLTIGDPQVISKIGLATRLDKWAFQIAEWQPESQLCLRICVDIWDSLFRDGLLTTTERTERMEKLEDLIAGKKPTPRLEMKGNNADSPLSGADSASNSKTSTGTSELKISSPSAAPRMSGQVELNKSGISVTPRRNAGIIGVHSAGAVFRFSRQSSDEENITGWKQTERILSRCILRILTNLIVKPLMVQIRYTIFWFFRLPDRRELEHRAIAATQYLAPDLSPLLQAHLGRENTSQGNLELSKHIHETYTTFCKPQKPHNGLTSVWSSSTHGKSAVPVPIKEPHLRESSSQMKFAKNFLSKGLSFRNLSGDGLQEDAWYTAAGAKKNVESMFKRLTTDSRGVNSVKSNQSIPCNDHEESFETICDPTDTEDNEENQINSGTRRIRSMSYESPRKLSSKVSINSKRRPDSSSPDKHRRLRKR